MEKRLTVSFTSSQQNLCNSEPKRLLKLSNDGVRLVSSSNRKIRANEAQGLWRSLV